MRLLSVVLLLSVAALVSRAGDEKKKDPGADDLKKLQGTWRLVSMTIDGRTVPTDDAREVTSVVKGNKVTVSHKGEVKAAATFTIDAGKKPRRMDAAAVLGPNKGKKSLAIYEIDAGTFKICSTEGKVRPKEFAAPEGTGYSLMVWKRAEK